MGSGVGALTGLFGALGNGAASGAASTGTAAGSVSGWGGVDGLSKPGSVAGAVGVRGSALACSTLPDSVGADSALVLALPQPLGGTKNRATATAVSSSTLMAAILTMRGWLLAWRSSRAQASGRVGAVAMARAMRLRISVCSRASPNRPGSAKAKIASPVNRPHSMAGGIFSSGRATPNTTSPSPSISARYTSAAPHR